MVTNLLRLELFALPVIISVILVQSVPDIAIEMVVLICAGVFASSLIAYQFLKKQFQKQGLIDKDEKQSEQIKR